MPIITKDGYTLTKEVLPQEYASTIPPLSITSDKIAEESVTADKLHPDIYLVPQGGIIMWSGSIVSIPTGWALCDGTNGTPDLRNKFIVGAGSTYAVAATGGSTDAVVVSHNHTLTDPGHAHSYYRVDSGTPQVDGADVASFVYQLHVAQTTGSSTTGVSIAAAGVSGVNANLPPYYAIAYIMKL